MKSNKQEFDELLKFCERPRSRVKVKFGDSEDFELLTGPEFLQRFKKSKSGSMKIADVSEVVGGDEPA